MKYDNRRILVISDTHYPYSHPDTTAFLYALNDKHDFTRVIHIGDEVDLHSASFHEKDPDLYGAGHELSAAITGLGPLYSAFPRVDVMDSNHGALYKRKIKHHGLPESVLKSSRDILSAPKGWKWHDELIVTLPNSKKVLFHHGKTPNALAHAKSIGMSTVCGHFHTSFSIQKFQTPLTSGFAMIVGCLIDPKSRAYGYQKNQVFKPIIGCGMILDSQPRLELMQLKGDGRWTGKLFK